MKRVIRHCIWLLSGILISVVLNAKNGQSIDPIKDLRTPISFQEHCYSILTHIEWFLSNRCKYQNSHAVWRHLDKINDEIQAIRQILKPHLKLHEISANDQAHLQTLIDRLTALIDALEKDDEKIQVKTMLEDLKDSMS